MAIKFSFAVTLPFLSSYLHISKKLAKEGCNKKKKQLAEFDSSQPNLASQHTEFLASFQRHSSNSVTSDNG